MSTSTTRPESAPVERSSEKGAEKSAVKTPSEMTLVGEKPSESLKSIQDLNSKISTDMPKDFGTGFAIAGIAGMDKPNGPTDKPNAGTDKPNANAGTDKPNAPGTDKPKAPGTDKPNAATDKPNAPGADKPDGPAGMDKATPAGLEFRTISGFIKSRENADKGPTHNHSDKGHRHLHASDRKGSDTASAAVSDQPGTTAEKTKIGSTEFSIKKDASGKPVEFTDKNGTWQAQKDGETFVNKGDKGDQPRFMRGTPSIDAAGNFTFKDSDFGTTKTNFKDGRSRTEIETASGNKIAIERDNKGMATRLEDSSGTWTSKNGKSWTNENGEKKTGEPSISAQGEYKFKDGSGKQTDQADSKQLTEAKTLQKEISEKYGVKIAGGGEKHHEYGLTSQASAKELRALDDTLARSNQMDLKGLQISFLGAGQAKGEGYGVYEENKLDLFQSSRVDPDSWLGIKGVGLHELVHHEQETMKSEDWRGANPPPEVAKMREALGWKYDQKFGPVRLDNQGGMWSPRGGEGDEKEGPQTGWTYVGGRDKPPPPGEHNINASKMEEIAKVKLASGYNTHPYESHAEAAALLRHNPEELAKKSPEAYKATRDWDQSRIDKKQAETGGEKMMRGVDGRIVADNADNRKAREEMERKYGI